MKPQDVISVLPGLNGASPAEILEHPAWAMSTRLGETPCIAKKSASLPAEILELKVSLESEPFAIGIADNPAFPDLHALWDGLGDMPSAIVLALVEKECGELLQLVENALRRQIKLTEAAKSPISSADGRMFFALAGEGDGGNRTEIVFSLKRMSVVETALGVLRNIDPNHEAIKAAVLPAEREYAAFQSSPEEISMLNPGDALLLPETDDSSARIVVAGKFALAEDGVTAWTDDGRFRVCDAAPSETTAGVLLDAIADASKAPKTALPENGTPLVLRLNGKTLKNGTYATIGEQKAFIAFS